MPRSKTTVVWAGVNLQPDHIQVIRGCVLASFVGTSKHCSQDIGSSSWKQRRDRLYDILKALDGETYTYPPVDGQELSDDAIITCVNDVCLTEADANLLAYVVKLYGETTSPILLSYTGYSAKHAHNLVDVMMEPVRKRLHAIAMADYDPAEERFD